MGEMEKMVAKWGKLGDRGEMGGNGGKWGKTRNCGEFYCLSARHSLAGGGGGHRVFGGWYGPRKGWPSPESTGRPGTAVASRATGIGLPLDYGRWNTTRRPSTAIQTLTIFWGAPRKKKKKTPRALNSISMFRILSAISRKSPEN